FPVTLVTNGGRY
ncbi:inner membrane transport YhaO domain protein, partial [Vibrio parahaemolyticus V-223/04]